MPILCRHPLDLANAAPGTLQQMPEGQGDKTAEAIFVCPDCGGKLRLQHSCATPQTVAPGTPSGTIWQCPYAGCAKRFKLNNPGSGNPIGWQNA